MTRKKRPQGPSARPVQVGEEIRHLLSQMLLEKRLRDPRLDRPQMLTVTDVRMTRDLRLARVLVSVFPGEPEVVEDVFRGLASAENEIKRAVGSELRLRFVPAFRFELDDSIDYGARIEQVLREIRAEEAGVPEEAGDPSPELREPEAGGTSDPGEGSA